MANVNVGDAKPFTLPPALLPCSPEYVLNDSASKHLVSLAKMTGGRERLRPSEVWERIPRNRHFANTAPLWAILAILLLLLEVAERRFSFLQKLCDWRRAVVFAKNPSLPQVRKPTFSFAWIFKRRSTKRAVAATETTEPSEPESHPVKPTPEQSEEESSLSKALRQANRNSKR